MFFRARVQDNLSESDASKFKEVFSMVDKDADGTVSAVELRAMMQSCGLGADVTMEEFTNVVNECDVDKLGRLDFPQFLEAMGRLAKEGEALDRENALLFQTLDRFGGSRASSSIDVAKLARLMAALGEQISEEEIADMISHATAGRSSEAMSFEQFLAFAEAEN